MERETKIFVTPNKHEVVLKSYITGYDVQQIEDIVYQSMDMKGMNNNPEVKLNAGFLTKQTNKALELLVVSIDGQTENILNLILDLKAEDYKAIVSEVNKITAGVDEEKKSE